MGTEGIPHEERRISLDFVFRLPSAPTPESGLVRLCR